MTSVVILAEGVHYAQDKQNEAVLGNWGQRLVKLTKK